MKIRHGFVSNSSSSSFILGFDRKPRSVAELHELLFGNMTHVEWFDMSFPTEKIANTIFNDLKKAKPLSVGKIIDEVESGYFEGMPDTWMDNNRLSDQLQKQFEESFPNCGGAWYEPDKITNTMAKRLAQKIRMAHDVENEEDRRATRAAAEKYTKDVVLPMMKGKKVYTLEYGDDINGAIEHGGVFFNIPSIQISHH